MFHGMKFVRTEDEARALLGERSPTPLSVRLFVALETTLVSVFVALYMLAGNWIRSLMPDEWLGLAAFAVFVVVTAGGALLLYRLTEGEWPP